MFCQGGAWQPGRIGQQAIKAGNWMSRLLYFDDLQVGDTWMSPARTITESDVVLFAGLTGDYDPLHVDHEFARRSPYGKVIAHGLLGLSWVAGLASQSPRVCTTAFVSIQRWEFRHPVFVGDTLHAVSRILDKRPAGRRCGHVTWQRDLVNQRGQVVQTGVFETLVNTEVSSRRRTDRGGVRPARHTRSANSSNESDRIREKDKD
jgi:acyl dehydratase